MRLMLIFASTAAKPFNPLYRKKAPTRKYRGKRQLRFCSLPFPRLWLIIMSNEINNRYFIGCIRDIYSYFLIR